MFQMMLYYVLYAGREPMTILPWPSLFR